MNATTDAVSRFGGFMLDRNSGGLFQLDEGGRWVRLALTSRAVDILWVLVARRGELVPKQEIMDAVWPDTTVEENNLTVHISAIRRMLDRDQAYGSCIQTVPGRGYRFVIPIVRNETLLPVEPGPISLDRSAPITHHASLPSNRPTIAVLAFANMSGDPEQEYFSDGVADDITGQLARQGSLFVLARSSSFSFKGRCLSVREIGRRLRVRYVLEGSVHRDGGRIRINVQLVEAETETCIWARRYERDLISVFVVLDEIAQAVVSELAPAIARAETERALRKAPGTLSSWEAYLRGLWHMWRQAGAAELGVAGSFFHQAVALDPLFADAHAMLARYYAAGDPAGCHRSYAARLAHAESEARTALRLDADNAAAYSTLALILSNVDGVSAQALAHAERAVVLNANDPSGHFVKGHLLVFEHRVAKARLSLDTALRLDPLGRIAVGVAHHLAVACFLERDHASAALAAGQLIRDHPHWPRIHPYRVASLGHLGQHHKARVALDDAMSVAPGYFDFRVRNRPPFCHPDDHEHLLEGLRKAGWNGSRRSRFA